MVPFEDSRRLLGSNPYFRGAGAALEVIGETCDAALIRGWRARVERAAHRLGWAAPRVVARAHASGLTLALGAPEDALFVATEINEWALIATLIERDPARAPALEQALRVYARNAAAGVAPAGADLDPVLEEAQALARFEHLARLERRTALRAVLEQAARRGLSHRLEESRLVLGSGAGLHAVHLGSPPPTEQIPWDGIHDVPTVLVTGSNGKTTTVRLIAACARAHGWHTGYNCTEGVFIDEQAVEQGDYSGPAGARRVLDETGIQAAVLETARGGILRRGITVEHARAAVVTNVSADHFGEYGIHDLEALARVKLAVAAALAPDGLLILNADDAALRAQVGELKVRYGATPALAWFSATSDACAECATASCAVSSGRLQLAWHESRHDLGSIEEMPLTLAGLASYNVANLAAAALAAAALGIAPATLRAVFARFGSSAVDNPGRLMRYTVRGATALLDYAHNPDGLRGFLAVAARLRRDPSRLAVLLGTAGNRLDADIEELARVAAHFRPDLIVIKENEAHLRGRAVGEVPGILAAELRRLGVPDSSLLFAASELEAARRVLEWARPGDVLAMPVHGAGARTAVLELIAAAR
ncbi:MAG TPA: Mur ligase family protein [Steroidobacteraceae bacterium]|nr:Mur ligase family protein [Steroidobacteraceae bacterium]